MAEVIICAGAGGVGKTTSAALLGVGYALAGKRAVVLTIDPARRLANALGIKALGNDPQRIPLDAPGSLDALMLDRKATWDDLVRHDAPDDVTAERLLENPYYAAVSTRLTGGHEYMATEKLYRLVHDDKWDVVIVDTPPAQHALDFFQAPDRIRRILDQRLMAPLFSGGGGMVGFATRKATGVIRRLAGDSVMTDIEDFFRLIGGLGEGLRDRGAAVHDLLRAPTTRYYLVTSANRGNQDEILEFLGVLRSERMHFAGIFLNRVRPEPPSDAEKAIAALPRDGATLIAIDGLRRLLATERQAADRHAALEQTLHEVTKAPLWPVPDLDKGIEDPQVLRSLAKSLPPHAEPLRFPQ